MENSPVKVTPDIQISGYNLKVEIFDDKNTVRSNAHVTLTSTSQLQVTIASEVHCIAVVISILVV